VSREDLLVKSDNIINQPIGNRNAHPFAGGRRKDMSKHDANQPADKQEPESSTTKATPVIDPIRAEIYKRADTRRDEASGDEGGEQAGDEADRVTGDHAAEGADAGHDTENRDNGNQPGGDFAEGEPEVSPDDYVQVKINGTVRMVSREKVEKAGGVEEYQKRAAIDEGFKTLAQRRKELEEKERLLAEREQAILAAAQTSPPATGGETGAPVSDLPAMDDRKAQLLDLVKAKNQAFLDGDDDKVAELELQILELNAAQAAPAQPEQQPSAEEIAAIAAKRAREELEREQQVASVINAKNRLLSEHPEIASDPMLFSAVDTQSAIIEAEGDLTDPYDILKEAHRRAVAWIAAQSKQDWRQERIDAKRNGSGVTGMTGRAPARKEEAKPKPTRSSYVEEIKRMRGQA